MNTASSIHLHGRIRDAWAFRSHGTGGLSITAKDGARVSLYLNESDLAVLTEAIEKAEVHECGGDSNCLGWAGVAAATETAAS